MKYFSPLVKRIMAACAACSWLLSCGMPIQSRPIKWAAFYGADASFEAFEPYEMLVFDLDSHPPLEPLQAQGKRILAYIAFSEIAPYRSYAAQFLQKPGFSIGVHERWNSNIIDIRDQEWQHFLLNTLIPNAMEAGFDGIFIDTLDSSLGAYQNDPIRFSGTPGAAAQLVKKARKQMPPKSFIMVNRAFEILPELVFDIDAVLAESILVDSSGPEFAFFSDAIYQQHVRQLHRLRQENPALGLFSLDYLGGRDIDTVSKITCTQSKHGFSPYVASLNLQEIMPALPCT